MRRLLSRTILSDDPNDIIYSGCLIATVLVVLAVILSGCQGFTGEIGWKYPTQSPPVDAPGTPDQGLPSKP